MAIDDDVPDFQSDQDEARYWRSLAKDLDSELDSTREALEEYQASSKELEQELERDIEAREKREAQLGTMLEVAQAEVQDWRAKFQSSLREHSKTLTHITKELDTVRKSEESYRTKVRDMELDNDDLEKSERAMGSTLSDLEARYGKAIERTALLEEELVSKARLEEEVQRLKDELRDLNEEMAVLQEQGVRPASRATDADPIRPETPIKAAPMSPEPPASQSDSSLLTDGPVPSTSQQSETPSSVEATPRKSAELSKTIKRTSGIPSGIPRSTSAQSVNASPTKPRLSASSTSPDVRFPASRPSPTSRISASATMTDLASAAGGKKTSTPQIRAKISPDVSARRRTASRAPSASPASTPVQRTTPKALREARANGMMHDLQSMTARVKAMTARVDGRRAQVDRPAWSTSIPKPAAATPLRTPMTTAQANAAQARIAARRAAARGGGAAGATHTTPRASVSRRSIASPGSLEDELSRAQVESPTSRAVPRRPPSRSASYAPRASSISRPTTPGFHRPTTPSGHRPRTVSRMGQRTADGMGQSGHLRKSSVKLVDRRKSVSQPVPALSDGGQDEEDERW